MTLMGYFDSTASEPTFDPGTDVICPLCAKPLGTPMKTISLMDAFGDRSYFYRTHKVCYDAMPEDEIARYEEALLGGATSERHEGRWREGRWQRYRAFGDNR